MASSNSNSADIGIRVFLQDAASAGLFAIDSNLGRIGQVARTSSMLFGDLSLKLAGLAVVAGLALSFAGFGAALVYSVKQAQDLTQALTDISLATDLTTQQMAVLTPFLFNLGANSIFSLQQLADGIAVVGQYGFKTTQQIELMAAAGVKLAEVTGSSTTDAFKLLAVTMQAFNIPASQANETAALLFFSIEHGTPNISNLTSALGQLGGVSVALHLSLADILPALDTVTVGMGSASTAAAGLRFFLVNIVHPTNAAAAEMQKLGISAFNAQGQFIGLKPLLQEIADKVSGLSDAAKADILGTLFNIRSGTAIKQLLNQITEFEQGVNKVSNAQKLQQQLNDAVAKVMDQLGSVVHTVASNFQDFAALVGTTVVPTLIGFLQKVVNPIVVQLRQWAQDPASAKIVSNFLMLGAAVSGVGLVIVGSFMSPVVAFIAIMALVAAAVIGVALLIQNFGHIWASLQPVLQRVWEVTKAVGAALLVLGAIIAGIQIAPYAVAVYQLAGILTNLAIVTLMRVVPAFIAMIPQLVAATVGFFASIPALLATIPANIAAAGAWFLHAAAVALAALPYILLVAIIAGAIVGLVLLIKHLGGLNVILGAAKAVWMAILPALQQAGAAIKGAFLQAIEQLRPVWNQLVQAFKQAEPALMFLGKILGGIIVVAVGILIGIIRGLINVIAAIVVTAIHVVAGIIQAFAGVIQFFTGLFTFIKGLFDRNPKEWQAGLQQMAQGIVNIFKGLWTAVSGLFTGAFSAIKGFVTGFIQGIIGFFEGLWDKLTRHSIIPEMLQDMLAAFLGVSPKIIGSVVGMIGQLLGHFKDLPGMILRALGNLGGLLLGAGQALIQGFINGILGMLGNIKNAVGNILGAVRNMFPHSPAKEGPLTDAHLWMPNLIHMLSDTAEQAGPSLKASMGRVAGGARAGLGTASGGTGGGAGGETYTLTVDGKAFMSFFHNKLTGELQANGLGRVMR